MDAETLKKLTDLIDDLDDGLLVVLNMFIDYNLFPGPLKVLKPYAEELRRIIQLFQKVTAADLPAAPTK